MKLPHRILIIGAWVAFAGSAFSQTTNDTGQSVSPGVVNQDIINRRTDPRQSIQLPQRTGADVGAVSAADSRAKAAKQRAADAHEQATAKQSAVDAVQQKLNVASKDLRASNERMQTLTLRLGKAQTLGIRPDAVLMKDREAANKEAIVATKLRADIGKLKTQQQQRINEREESLRRFRAERAAQMENEKAVREQSGDFPYGLPPRTGR